MGEKTKRATLEEDNRQKEKPARGGGVRKARIDKIAIGIFVCRGKGQSAIKKKKRGVSSHAGERKSDTSNKKVRKKTKSRMRLLTAQREYSSEGDVSLRHRKKEGQKVRSAEKRNDRRLFQGGNLGPDDEYL